MSLNQPLHFLARLPKLSLLQMMPPMNLSLTMLYSAGADVAWICAPLFQNSSARLKAVSTLEFNVTEKVALIGIYIDDLIYRIFYC